MRSSKPAVVLVGHGSSTRGFDAPLRKVAAALRRDKRYSLVLCSYLNTARPDIAEAITECVTRGATEVRVLPYFVLNGKHVLSDIPKIVRDSARAHRGRCRVILCDYLGFHPALLSVVKARLNHG